MRVSDSAIPWAKLAALGLLLFASTLSVDARELTFEDRVAAQEQIERIYYRYQIGTTKPFEEAVPHTTIEAKVRKYLRQSVVLEKVWDTKLTGEMLQTELERIARGSRLPERLLEIYAALGNDAFVVRECVARATLVDRLTRNRFDHDPALRAKSRDEAEVLRQELETGAAYDVAVLSTSDSAEAVLPVPARLAARTREHSARDDETPVSSVNGGACEIGDIWGNGILDDVPPFPRSGHSAVWTGSRMVVWGGSGEGSIRSNTGGVYDPATDTWSPTSRVGAPQPRERHTAVWTGSRMVIWGGIGANDFTLDSGGVYDPETDTWTPTSTIGSPLGRNGHTAVWTGNRMIVWGGDLYRSSGGAYDPETNTWTPISVAGAPGTRYGHTAVWTGSRMVVWGGGKSVGTFLEVFNSGGVYDPVADSWTSTSTVGAPEARWRHTAVWTGNRMVVWGGTKSSRLQGLNSGAQYDPETNTWTSTPISGAPEARSSHSAVWTGSRMVTWGGVNYDGNRRHFLGSGGVYDPIGDTWSPTSPVDAPRERRLHTAVWTGSRMIVWGGVQDGDREDLDTGGAYDPATDSWTSIADSSGAPQGGLGHTAVWTGSLMVVWGGLSYTTSVGAGTGAVYDPVTDSWTPTSTAGAPDSRGFHSAVWTGSRMVVWGGEACCSSNVVNTGGVYDPGTNAWSATAITTAPDARSGHTAVWTGTRMLVWGGGTGSDIFNTGGSYDLTGNAWTAIPTASVPDARRGHTAVWTGTRMVVWGGSARNTGGVFDPAAGTSGTWRATSTVTAPAGRSDHTVVWTGTRMIVWGGRSASTLLDTGGLYDPSTDTWAATATEAAPTKRSGHTAVWTGIQMIVWTGVDGAAYHPTLNSWTPIPSAGAPEPRAYHTAVWTGSRMIVWGGQEGPERTVFLKSGGTYIPASRCSADDSGGDLLVNFGTNIGLWTYANNSSWSPLLSVSPEIVVTGDLDGNGADEVVVDLGNDGIWVYDNGTSWRLLLQSPSPTKLGTADLDGNGQDELIADFGTGQGLRIYENNTSWRQLHASSSKSFTAGDLDGSGQDDLLVDFGAGMGLWVYVNNSAWVLLHTQTADSMTIANLNGNACDDLVVDFGAAQGIHILYDATSWRQLHGLSPVAIEAGDIDGNGTDELVVNFGGPNGVWIYENNTSWSRLHGLSPELIRVADMNQNGQADLVVDFGATQGLWVYADGSTWSFLHGLSPVDIAVGTLSGSR